MWPFNSADKVLTTKTDLIRIRFKARYGYSWKQIEKDITKILGKNLENVVQDFNNLFNLGNPWKPGRYLDMSEIMAEIHDGSDMAVVIKGKSARDLNSKWPADQNRYAMIEHGSIRLSVHCNIEYMRELMEKTLTSYAMTGFEDYLALSGDTKTFGIPDECKSCNYNFRANMTECEALTEEGGCWECGFHIFTPDVKWAMKVLGKAEELEKSTGKKIYLTLDDKGYESFFERDYDFFD